MARWVLWAAAVAAVACATGTHPEGATGGTGGAAGLDASAGDGGGSAGASGSGGTGATTFDSGFDVSTDGGFDPDAACATTTEAAQVTKLPVDIIWMVDNSASMKPAVDQVNQGLNDFAALIAGKNLDYRVIMLSLIGKSPVTSGGSTLYPICIPPPLAGDSNCGNGTSFFQVTVDIKSTQPLEQFLGTLGQTAGYLAGDARGSQPWKQWLRPEATKTIVVVTDDNSRLVANDFEHFAGGQDPAPGASTSLFLPPGILDPSWNDLFKDYTFDALYGWGSDTDPSVKCSYPGGGTPPASGQTYTDLVTKTNGVRAKICDGATAWGPFFDEVAQAVSKASKINCQVAIPQPEAGTLDPGKINVALDNGSPQLLYKVKDAGACDATGGWYYDNDAAPTQVILCPASCDAAQQAVQNSDGGSVSLGVQFGCTTIVK